MPFDKKKSFSVRVVNTKGWISLGVISSKERVKDYTDSYHPYSILYDGKNGSLKGDERGKIVEGTKTIDSGDIVSVSVNLVKG